MVTGEAAQPMDEGQNESFYFNFYDRGNDLFMFVRIGLMPNMNERSAFCFIMMPDGATVWMREMRPFGVGRAGVGGLRMETVDADRRWKLAFDGHMDNMAEEGLQTIPVSFSLNFEALNEMFDYEACADADNAEIFRQVAQDHVEQFGKASGSLMVGEQQYDISGLGERAHTQGIRDPDRSKLWIWLSAQFSRSLAFNLTKLFTDKEAIAGYLHMNGRNVALVKADVRTVLDPDGTPGSLAISSTDADGGRHRMTAEVLRVVTVPFPSRDGKRLTVVHEALVEFDLNGQKGYGMAEYLVRKG
ncbi:MAG: hypothetical protein ISF22_08970 [Methanomassiliicoccus sp.]|nr:hypothetical protein [Methanomassiliicoccus sp.]